MGQAKARGTLEQRKAEAVKKRQEELARRKAHLESLSPEQRKLAALMLGLGTMLADS